MVSPAYTAGLEGTPNELKLKYLADNDFAGLDGEELRQAIKGRIAAKDGSSLVGNMVSEGTPAPATRVPPSSTFRAISTTTPTTEKTAKNRRRFCMKRRLFFMVRPPGTAAA